MATLKPRGKMTRPLMTMYSVGDHIMLTRDVTWADMEPERGPQVGDTGTIKQVLVADPNDGDDTFLLFRVRWASGRTWSVGEGDLTRAYHKPSRAWRPSRQARQEAEAWLRRQLDSLSQ